MKTRLKKKITSLLKILIDGELGDAGVDERPNKIWMIKY